MKGDSERVISWERTKQITEGVRKWGNQGANVWVIISSFTEDIVKQSVCVFFIKKAFGGLVGTVSRVACLVTSHLNSTLCVMLFRVLAGGGIKKKRMQILLVGKEERSERRWWGDGIKLSTGNLCSTTIICLLCHINMSY